ncbi:inositol monophosphatase family protein [Halorubrum halodurans]|uniref:fructose-bisphosphatase n=1 Tax=Halorubrum halodurans TaxID=1383851 RepID=A0A256IIZ4_9EURY|nr:inositol monophosphatase family protein [Halorubrum halodurans]OYR56433.1 inositol monophosphatase [Halorubrum halodurans]
MTDLDTVESVARAAALAGGAELRERYRNGDAAGEYDETDVKAAADAAAEARMLPVVRRAFPDHPVFAEEAGRFDGTGPYRWVIDPLDGTNDFAAGLPTFAASVAVLDAEDDEPALAAVRQPATEETYLARRDAGVTYEGERVTAESDVALEASTVAMIVGRDVPRDTSLSGRADAIREGVAGEVKRTIDSWAPTVHSGLLARGRIQGLVQFHPDEEERAVTELFASEAGAAVRREGSLYVAAPDGERLDALWTAIDDAR